MRYLPPTRASHLAEGVVASPVFSHGTNHCLICSGSVQALKTRSRGALIRRSNFNLMFSDVIAVMTFVFLSFGWFDRLFGFGLFFPDSRPMNRAPLPRICGIPRSIGQPPASVLHQAGDDGGGRRGDDK